MRSRCRCLAALIAIALLASEVPAQSDDEGHFEVLSASHKLVNGVYQVDARFDLDLSYEATQTLESYVPLTIRIEVQLLHRLRLWWDLVAYPPLSVRWQLSYHPFTEGYIVRNLSNPEDYVTFTTLAGALAFIGRVDDLPVIDAAVLENDRRYDIRVRAVLETAELPGPLALIAFWRNDWSTDSGWLRWHLDEE